MEQAVENETSRLHDQLSQIKVLIVIVRCTIVFSDQYYYLDFKLIPHDRLKKLYLPVNVTYSRAIPVRSYNSLPF